MGENKGQTIFLSVIGIATLLVAIIGATFAYFTTTVTNNSSEVTVQTAKVANVTMTSTLTGISDILPGYDYNAGTVTLTTDINASSQVTIPYTCTLVYTNPVKDLQYKIATTSDEGTKGSVLDNADSTWKDLQTTATNVAKGTLTATNKVDSFDISYRFKETGTNQNNNGEGELGQSNKSSNITFSCQVDGQYYTNGIANGTAVAPSTQAD